uniref:PH domain-containing protein n=1 Tax=Ciona savignyi TaxID=51511 RepID=H2ZQ11_CIOSA
ILSKWIGFLSGWNEKYFVLHNGTLSCFASKDDRLNGIPAKETFNLGLCEINVDQVTPTQFELKGTVDSKVWSLKTETAGERQKWIQALGSAKACLLDSSSLGYLGKSSDNTELLSSSGIQKTSTNDCETLATSFDSISFETNETTADENGTGSMNNLLLSSENRSVQEEPETKLELQSIIQLCEQTKADITFLQNVFGHAPVNVDEMEAMIGRLEITLQNFIQTIKLNKSVLCGDEVVEHSISE